MEHSFLSISCLSHNLPNISSGSTGDIDGGSDGQCARSGPRVDGRPAGDGERGDRGKVFAVVRLSNKLFPTSSRANQVQFPGALGLDILFPLFTQLRYEKNTRIVGLKGPSICLIPVGWGYSWRIARKVQIVRTFRGSRCLICMEHANRFPNFLSFPPDCSASRVLEYLLRFHSLPPKRVPVFQLPPVIKKIGHVKRKFHEVIGGMRCGPARRWVQAHLDVRKTSGKRWLREFQWQEDPSRYAFRGV